MREPKSPVRVCDSCPWIKTNQGKPHPAGWFTTKNIRRLWNGLRMGKAPGMVCHASDPANVDYGGDVVMKEGQQARECGGALIMVIRNVNAVNDGKPQPTAPPMTKRGIIVWLNRYLFQGVPAVESKLADEEVGVPWQK